MLLPRGLALRDISFPGHLRWKSSSMWQGSYQVTGPIIMSHVVSHKRQSPGETWAWRQHCYCHHAFSTQPLPPLGSEIQTSKVGPRWETGTVSSYFSCFWKVLSFIYFWGEGWKSEDAYVSSLFSPYGFWELNSGHLIERTSSFPEPPPWPL